MPWFDSRQISTARAPPLTFCLAVALIYVIAGRLGLLLAVPPGYATAIFPPAGIAMAAAIIGGPRVLPWIFAGSCMLNVWIGAAVRQSPGMFVALALLIAVASTAQAALGAWSLRRFVRHRMALDNPRDLGRFFIIAPLTCLTSASISLAGMALLGTVGLSQLAANWFSWWIGDTLGVLMFLPLVMVLAGEPRRLWRSRMLPVALPMLLFFALFVAIFVRTCTWEHDQSLTEFRLLSQDVRDKLQFELAAQTTCYSNSARRGAARRRSRGRISPRLSVRCCSGHRPSRPSNGCRGSPPRIASNSKPHSNGIYRASRSASMWNWRRLHPRRRPARPSRPLYGTAARQRGGARL